MRCLPLAALALLACGGSADRGDTPATRDASASSPAPTGPDVVVLRVARAGGRVRASVYPAVDSVVWTSAGTAPPVARVLGFDESAGSLALVDSAGIPQRVNLRSGAVARASRTRLTALASPDGSGIYGVSDGAVTRLTPTDTKPWATRFAASPRAVLPQSDGTVLVVADRAQETLIWRVRPPDSTAIDTAALPLVGRAIASPAGDRIYFATDSGLAGVQSRTLEPVDPVALGARVRDAVATPSGDRVYVAVADARELRVVNRYRGEVTSRVELPGPAGPLRMDPLGRYLLVRAESGDSAWVVAIGTDRVVGAVGTEWRTDLPLVAPDGMIVAVRAKDVLFVDGETLRERQRVANGAADFWHVLVWNGFRPRPGDEPRAAPADRAPAPVAVAAAPPDSAPPPAPAASPPADSAASVAPTAATAAPDSAARPAGGAARPSPTTGAPSAPPAATAPAPPPAPKARRGFTVQFAAVGAEPAAREVASAVAARGPAPRIVATQTSGATIYRVVLGPFPTEAEAERAGKQSGRDYWVYEGEP